jgi:hypothetical protein
MRELETLVAPGVNKRLSNIEFGSKQSGTNGWDEDFFHSSCTTLLRPPAENWPWDASNKIKSRTTCERASIISQPGKTDVEATGTDFKDKCFSGTIAEERGTEKEVTGTVSTGTQGASIVLRPSRTVG